MTTRAPLDRFETALLTELRQQVALRGADAAPARTPRRRRLAALGATVVAAGAITAGAFMLRPDAAFAVEREDDGDVVVTIRSWDDAEGLQEALEAEGVEAVVAYDGSAVEPLPDGPGPIDPDEAQTAERGAEKGTGPDHGLSAMPEDGPGDTVLEPGREARICPMDVRTDFKDDNVTFRLPASAVDSDAVLHLVTTGGMESDAVASLAIWWEGEPC